MKYHLCASATSGFAHSRQHTFPTADVEHCRSDGLVRPSIKYPIEERQSPSSANPGNLRRNIHDTPFTQVLRKEAAASRRGKDLHYQAEKQPSATTIGNSGPSEELMKEIWSNVSRGATQNLIIPGGWITVKRRERARERAPGLAIHYLLFSQLMIDQ
jgi:hypothetical protein